MSVTTSEHINLLSTSPQRQRPPSMLFTLPQLPTFESTWDFSQFRSQSPDLPVTPSPTRITSPAVSPSKTFINTTQEDYSPRSGRNMCFRAPPPSPRFEGAGEGVKEMNEMALKEACTYASLALSISKSSTELSAVPGLMDSFTSSASYSSDEHTDSDAAEEDAYHASANQAWDRYYNFPSPAKVQEHQDEVMEQSYILPSAESCYALGFGKLGCPSTPSPVKHTSPIRRQPVQSRPSPLRTRTAPSPVSVNTTATARPNISMRRRDSGKSARSTRTLTQQRYNNKPSEHPLCRTTTVSRPRPKYEASLSFTQALESIPPPALPMKLDIGWRTKSPPKDYTPPYLSLFPMSSRHSTPNGEVPPFPVPTRRAPRPVTAPCVGSTSTLTLGIQASTTVLGSAGGVIVVEKSVWEEDSDDEEVVTKKWHIRNLSGEGKRSVRRREKEKWGKRSASDVVKGLFGLQH